jgi:hypothetical protein
MPRGQRPKVEVETQVQCILEGLAGTDIIHLIDGWQEVEEREWDAGDTRLEPRRQFVSGGLYIDEPLIFNKDTDSDGDCTDAGGSSRYFYAQQATWNVVAVIGSDGTIVEKIQYDPYGQATLTVQQGQSAASRLLLRRGDLLRRVASAIRSSLAAIFHSRGGGLLYKPRASSVRRLCRQPIGQLLIERYETL